MKKLYLILMLFVVTGSVFGQTNVSGNQSGTWDINGSPYYVIGDVTVVTGTTLIIEPGVEVLFDEDMTIIVNGYFFANGDEISQIIFDSEIQGEKWNGVQIINSTSSTFEFCEISNSKNGGINIDNSSNILIDNCSIHDNTSNEGAGINISNGSSEITIQYSTINNNVGNMDENDEMIGGGGIVCANSSIITIKLNYINTNERDDFGGGIHLLNCTKTIIDDNSINNNISSGSGGGIQIDVGEDNWVQNNLIYSNSSFSGGGMFIKTACNIVGNEIYNNNAISGGGIFATDWSIDRYFTENIIHHNIAQSLAGGLLIAGYGPYPIMENCEIYSNEATDNNGGGLYITSADPILNNCMIYDNIALSGDGGGIFVSGGSPQLYRTVIRDNKAENGGGIFLHNTVPYPPQPVCNINQCVIAGNEASIRCGGLYVEALDDDNVSNVDSYNSIFFDNIATQNTGNEIYIEDIYNGFYSRIKYNCIEQGGLYIENNNHVFTEGNIFDDPEFTNPDDYDYYLLPDSPCINTGHPEWPLDPDGTRADIGIIPFDHVFDIKFFHADYNWISFPKLPVDGTSNTYQPVSADNIMDILNTNDPEIHFPLFLEFLYEDDDVPVLLFDSPNWISIYNPENYHLYSSRGYKLKTEEPENTDISIVGLRLEEDTPIDLEYGENWVGYWLPNSQDIDDAFGDDFDKVYSIKAEDWEWKYTGNIRGINDPIPEYYPIRPLQYGKGYVITLMEGIDDFQWQPGLPAMVEEIPKAQGFEYNVLPDYETVIIDTIEGGENVSEVGAFIDDVCVGAAVVEEYPVQLLAYIDNVRASSGLTFEVLEGERGEAQKVMYHTLNLQTGDFENMSIFPGRLEHNIVKLNIKTLHEPEVPIPNVFNLERNYPNPFNPTTTISFSVAQTTSDVSLEIFNIKGQKVKTLYSGIAEEGKHSIVWNGEDENNKSVSSGIYFYKLTTGKKELTRKMLMLK